VLLAAAIALASGDAAAQRRPGPGAPPPSPSRTLTPGAGQLDPAPAPIAPDAWVGRDKALHLCATAALAGGGYGLGSLAMEGAPGRLALGAALALGAGAGKEALDGAGFGTPSFRDLLWDVIGATFGLAFALSVDVAARPASFDPRR
jgi:putative lipoprotein